MSSKSVAAVLAACVSVLLLTRAPMGQSIYGYISGTLTSTSKKPISGAKVTVTSVEKGSTFTTTTNESGNYSVADLVPDTYDITVEADGFKTFQESGIPVFADQTSRVNAELPAGIATEVVGATPGEVNILKIDRTDVSTGFLRPDINGLPIRDLDFTRFELLVPGALPAFDSLAGSQNPQRGRPVAINGQFFSGTAFQLDGTDNRDPLEGLIVINPTLESVGEVKVTTQSYGLSSVRRLREW